MKHNTLKLWSKWMHHLLFQPVPTGSIYLEKAMFWPPINQNKTLCGEVVLHLVCGKIYWHFTVGEGQWILASFCENQAILNMRCINVPSVLKYSYWETEIRELSEFYTDSLKSKVIWHPSDMTVATYYAFIFELRCFQRSEKLRINIDNSTIKEKMI